ncbi:MAG: tetratricopeptide repeat protein [candidate division Zixibacteria bacterium]|nr:tetratricopeptide repeat protein [candidate division Zixibacteria bacterium]
MATVRSTFGCRYTVPIFALFVAFSTACAPVAVPQKTGTVTVEKLIHAGNVLVAGGQYEAAIAQYERALAMDVTSAEAHGNLSVAYYYLNRYDAAVREAHQAVVMAPGELNWRFNLGAAYSRKGDMERAVTAYQGAVELARRLKDDNRNMLRSALIGYGRACELAEKYDQALDAYREAIVFAPGDVELLAGVGNIHFRRQAYEKAEEIYRQALAADSTHTMSRYNLGLVLARTGRFDQAISLFSSTPGLAGKIGGIEGSALNTVGRSRATQITAFRSQFGRMGGTGAPQTPHMVRHPPYTYALGLTYYEQGNTEAAIDAFKRALTEDPSLAEAYLYIGNLRVREDRLQDAIEAYKSAVRADSLFVEAYNNLGSIYAETGQFEQSMTAYRQALALDDRFFDARTNLGLLYAEAGRLDEAVAEYTKVIRAEAGVAEAHNNLAMIYLQQGRFEEAITQSKKAIGLRKNFPEAYNNLGLAYGQRASIDDVVDIWRTFTARWAGDDRAGRAGWLLLRRMPAGSSAIGGVARDRYYTGVEHAYRGRFDEALAAFETALDTQPSWSAPLLAAGATLMAQDRYGSASQTLQKALRLDPSDPLGYGLLAIAQAMGGSYREAVKTWEETVKYAEEGDRAGCKTALETVRPRQEYADQAFPALETAIKLRPDFPKAHFNLGVLQDIMHRYPEAIAAYEQAAALAPDAPAVHFRLGIARYRIGRMTEAQAAIRKYISLVTDPMLLPQVETFLKHITESPSTTP